MVKIADQTAGLKFAEEVENAASQPDRIDLAGLKAKFDALRNRTSREIALQTLSDHDDPMVRALAAAIERFDSSAKATPPRTESPRGGTSSESPSSRWRRNDDQPASPARSSESIGRGRQG